MKNKNPYNGNAISQPCGYDIKKAKQMIKTIEEAIDTIEDLIDNGMIKYECIDAIRGNLYGTLKGQKEEVKRSKKQKGKK